MTIHFWILKLNNHLSWYVRSSKQIPYLFLMNKVDLLPSSASRCIHSVLLEIGRYSFLYQRPVCDHCSMACISFWLAEDLCDTHPLNVHPRLEFVRNSESSNVPAGRSTLCFLRCVLSHVVLHLFRYFHSISDDLLELDREAQAASIPWDVSHHSETRRCSACRGSPGWNWTLPSSYRSDSQKLNVQFVFC